MNVNTNYFVCVCLCRCKYICLYYIYHFLKYKRDSVPIFIVITECQFNAFYINFLCDKYLVYGLFYRIIRHTEGRAVPT